MPKTQSEDPKTASASSKSSKNPKEKVNALRQKKKVVVKKNVPMFIYWLKDILRDFISHKNFADALATTFALASISFAAPFLPPTIIIPLLILTFILTMVHPLIGLMALFFESLPMFIYQTPLLAWLFMLFMGVAFLFGFKHYRTITFIYMLSALPFSNLGYFIEIPAFVFTVMVVGTKRGVISAIIAVLIVCMVSGLTGLQNTGSLAFDATLAHSVISGPAINYTVPSKSVPSLSNLSSAWSSAVDTFFSFKVTGQIINGMYLSIKSLSAQPMNVAIELVVWVLLVFVMSSYVIGSRSKYKGTIASTFSILIPITYLGLSYATRIQYNLYPFIGFAITPLIFLFLELNDIPVIKALDVMKQDFRAKFGEGFEDLTSGSNETLDDVADYEETKEELKTAIISPIEHREIAGAYGVKPAKGILLFGPPGTGKTLIMRALSNEIRAGFFYVKASSILSPYAGESAQAISRIFAVAKKHAPCVLFFDEIDGIASAREVQETETGKQILSTLLSEMDGFQKVDNVVIVGATNAPNLIDPSLLRPGRFDKLIYMPLPDAHGRAEIFKYYLSKLPIGNDIDYEKLAEITERYSGADIKNVCDEAAREVAEEATTMNKVLEITMSDLINVIKMTKPSTSLSKLEEYMTFKMDYERRLHPEKLEKEKEEHVSLEDVIDLEEAKRAIYEAVEIPIIHPDLVKKYDVQNIKGILLFGPPGTGKTMLMRAVASEIGDVHMIVLSGADIAKAGLDKAILTIKEAFNRAKENAPSIIFVDEIDAVVPNREVASELGTELAGEFLQEIDGITSKSGIVLVGATNRPDALDPALVRAGRFDKLIFVPPPNEEQRAELFNLYLKKAPLSDDIDFRKLGKMTPGFTGADIANLCRQAKMNALEESVRLNKEVKISMNDLIALIEKTKPSAPSMVIGKYLSFLSTYGQR
ncbi:MAG: AAA family ATPase [Candidatus Micrarchaeales archaeon]